MLLCRSLRLLVTFCGFAVGRQSNSMDGAKKVEIRQRTFARSRIPPDRKAVVSSRRTFHHWELNSVFFHRLKELVQPKVKIKSNKNNYNNWICPNKKKVRTEYRNNFSSVWIFRPIHHLVLNPFFTPKKIPLTNLSESRYVFSRRNFSGSLKSHAQNSLLAIVYERKMSVENQFREFVKHTKVSKS